MIRIPSIPPVVGKVTVPSININHNIKTIFISIASYRDPDLINTVRSAYDNAAFKDRLFFSIVSQAEDFEHPDLSFIPENQIRYEKILWELSDGACWAREIASRDIDSDYYLQIDSHSRFIPNWDKVVIENYSMCKKYWKSDIAFTMHPRGFRRDHETGEEEFYDFGKKPLVGYMGWTEGENMPQPIWYDIEYFKYGYEAYFLCANSLFCDTKIIKAIPYDENLYFIGEEPTLALRFYTRGVKLINPSFHYMWHAYNPNYKTEDRRLHWQDNPRWLFLNKLSYHRAAKILSGDMSFGVYGIGSKDLYDEFQEKAGITLYDKHDKIISGWNNE
jgi:hypothetical protein